MRNIRDMHTQTEMTVFQMLERYRIVEILRIITVDGEQGHVA